jgi:cysteine desulfurase
MVTVPVYLDYHATTPCDPRVVDAMLPWFTRDFGNASSRQHAFGWKAAEGVKIARENIAELIGASPDEIIFTSGATESINLALKGIANKYAAKGRHIITTITEHAAVLDTCSSLEKSGVSCTYLNVDGQGRISLDALRATFRPDTILVSVMIANNETGLIQDIKAISELCREKGVIFFTDATQAMGKIPVNIQEMGIDLLALSAHKFYGPKGVGALFVRRRNPRVQLSPLLDGGGHEKGLRSGTLNVPGIIGMGKAAQLAMIEMEGDMNRVRQLRDHLEQVLCREPQVFVNGSIADRLATVTNLSFGYTEGPVLLAAVTKQIAVSTGSACSSASLEPSHVLTAMGLGKEMAYASLRISLGRFTTEPEIHLAENLIIKTLRELRHQGQLWDIFKNGLLPDNDPWKHPSQHEGLVT